MDHLSVLKLEATLLLHAGFCYPPLSHRLKDNKLVIRLLAKKIIVNINIEGAWQIQGFGIPKCGNHVTLLQNYAILSCMISLTFTGWDLEINKIY
jgi:hypothetical protein